MKPSKAAEQVKAGAAKVAVSPDGLERGRVWLGGYKPNRYATQQRDAIEARAVAIGRPGRGLLMVTVDTCIISPLTAARWARAISRIVPLPERRIFITATHTHSGPDLTWFFGGVPIDYHFKIRSGVIEAAKQAWESRAPAELYVGTGNHSMGMPRRAGKGQTDMDAGLVALQWRAGGAAVATLFNIGCHGVVFPRTSRLLSGDLPGELCRAADAEFGGVSLFMPRIQGDVNPDLPGEDAYFQNGTESDLERLAGEGLRALKKTMSGARRAPSAPVTVRIKEVDVKVKKPLAPLFLGPWWTGRLVEKPGRVTMRFSKFRIGGIEGITVAGEALTDLGRAMLDKMETPALLFTYTNGYYGYLMMEESWRRGGYEPAFAFGPVDPECFFYNTVSI